MIGQETSHNQACERLAQLILRRRDFPIDTRQDIVPAPSDTLLISQVERAELVMLLGCSANKLSGGLWWLEEAEPALAGILEPGYTVLLLHPAGADVEGLTQIPPDMRLFCIDTNVSPYRIFQVAPARDIPFYRQLQAGVTAERRWETTARWMYDSLLHHVERALQKAQPTLDARLTNKVKRLIGIAEDMDRKDRALHHLMEAASHLEILEEVLAALLQQD